MEKEAEAEGVVRVRGGEEGANGTALGNVSDGGYDGDAAVTVIFLVTDGDGELCRDGPVEGGGAALEDVEEGAEEGVGGKGVCVFVAVAA